MDRENSDTCEKTEDGKMMVMKCSKSSKEKGEGPREKRDRGMFLSRKIGSGLAGPKAKPTRRFGSLEAPN